MRIVKTKATILFSILAVGQLNAEIVTPTSATHTSAFAGFGATRLINGSGLDGGSSFGRPNPLGQRTGQNSAFGGEAQ